MIKIENVVTPSSEQWLSIIRGMRNPMNSWDKSDSSADLYNDNLIIGENDLSLMKKLSKAGTDHRKFLRMITVYMDITAPLYWWKEFDTYKVGTITNSCSTMHKIQSKKFELDDFSHEHLTEHSKSILLDLIKHLNIERNMFNVMNDKVDWWQMIQLLPSSYNQKRTIVTNYEMIANTIKPGSRLNHKLDEWNVNCNGSWCNTIMNLPYFREIVLGDDN